jgi:uncharacterized membrane protein YfcA
MVARVARITLEVISVIFVATVVRSAFGFGDALIGVPLLALLMPVTVAAPLSVLVSITIAALVLAQDWRHIQFRGAANLLIATIFGIPIGLFLLTHAPQAVVKAVLGVLITAFSLYSIRSHHTRLSHDRWAWPFGFVAGILGGAYAMNGPPVAVYGSLRRWPPAQFRATLQGYFLPASVVGMFGYWWTGLWTPTVTRLYVLSLPVVIGAILVGRVVNRRLSAGRFVRYVYGGLVATGIVLLMQAVSGR